MSDADLRRLQRASQEDPSNLHLAHEYIRELERSTGIPSEVGRVRDFEVGEAPRIVIDRQVEADRTLWQRLSSFASFVDGARRLPATYLIISVEAVCDSPESFLIEAGYPEYAKWTQVINDVEEARDKGYKYLVFRKCPPTQYESFDIRMRRAQRQASVGDPQAQQRYERMRRQSGLY